MRDLVDIIAMNNRYPLMVLTDNIDEFGRRWYKGRYIFTVTGFKSLEDASDYAMLYSAKKVLKYNRVYEAVMQDGRAVVIVSVKEYR